MSTRYGSIESGKSPVDCHRLLGSHPFFKGLDTTIVAQLGPRAVTRHLDKGGVLFRKGDPVLLYAVVRGAIRISAPSASGGDAVLNLMIPGDVFWEVGDAGWRHSHCRGYSH